MNRTTLERILDHAEGISRENGGSKDASEFGIQEGHRVTFYLGRPGQAMEISDVSQCVLHEDFVEVSERESDNTSYIEYDAIHAVAAKPPKGEARRRAGFA